MIRDEDLKSSIDYSEGQKRAAHRVLVELVNVFREYEDEIRVVGGWVPDLMFPEEGHVGSVDVDIILIILLCRMKVIRTCRGYFRKMDTRSIRKNIFPL